MRRSILFTVALLSLGIVLAACGGTNAEIERAQLQTTDESLTFDFESGAQGFETTTIANSELVVENGQYQVTSLNDRGNHYLVGNNPEVNLKNVVIEVEVEQLNGTNDGWFGVVCRTHGNDVGYALLISADGFWSIARISESVSGLQSLDYLENWKENSAINTAGTNQIEVYCVDDYFALYVNGEFVGDHRDDTYNHSGGVGLLAGNVEDEVVTVAFDNLTVRGAYREGNPNTATPAPTTTPTPEAIATLPPLDSLGDTTTDDTATE